MVKNLFCCRLKRPLPFPHSNFKLEQKGLALVFLFCLLSCLLSFPSPSYPKVYKWIDEKGNIHFADNLSEVPPGGTIIEIKEFVLHQPSSPKPKLDSKKEKEGPKPEKIKDKSQKEDWQKKLADIQKEIKEKKATEQALETELKRPKYKQLVRKEKLLQKKLEETKKEIARLEKERTELEQKLEAAQ